MLRRRVQMVLLVYVSDYWTAPEHLQLNPQKRCSCLVSRSLLCLCPSSFCAQAGHEAYFNKETCALSEQLAVHVSLVGRITDIPNLFHFYSCLYIVITFVFIFKCDGCVCTHVQACACHFKCVKVIGKLGCWSSSFTLFELRFLVHHSVCSYISASLFSFPLAEGQLRLETRASVQLYVSSAESNSGPHCQPLV